ncbi:hypothetical protein SSP35_09_00540 [Streptomyces sp. NBRC 110611]|nr:hypothetical protein SSP35_09_00540 [Streptomyces sp. NBRC 110611]
MAASLVGISVAATPQAMAMGDGHGAKTVNGNGSKSIYGNSTTRGKMSTQLGLAQGSLNDLCAALIGEKLNVGSLVGGVPVTVQDINVLSNPQVQQCVSHSAQAKGDESLAHVLDGILIGSNNGGGGKKR